MHCKSVLTTAKMSVTSILLIGLAIGLVALLYSSVGHAGASGYIAVLALAGMSDETIRPTALVLNIVVATIATWQFASQGHFSWKLFWPFAVAAIPMAYVGGYYKLPTTWFHLLVGMILLFSAFRLMMPSRESEVIVAPNYYLSIPAGGVLGLLAGLTGTGGGIFLTPLILLMGWANPKSAGAVSAPFILCNSLAGLAGNLSQTLHLPNYVGYWGAIVLLAGFAGSRMGSKQLPSATIKQLLAAVLIIAGSKLVVSGLASWL
jgi:uncharacterized membrane protein YfcA